MHSGVFGLAVGRRSREMEQKIQINMIQSMRRREQKKTGMEKVVNVACPVISLASHCSSRTPSPTPVFEHYSYLGI